MDKFVELRVEKVSDNAEAGLGRARIDTVTRAKLGVEAGGTIEITGTKMTVAKVFRSKPEDEGLGIIRIDGMTRTNAGASIDQSVKVRRCDPKPAEKVVLAPNIPQGKRIKFEDGAVDFFRTGLMNRPVIKGSDIMVPNVALGGNRSMFVVVSTVPQGPVTIGQGTEITLKEETVTKRDSHTEQVTYDDVGGLDDELRKVREMIELPMKHPELFIRLGITSPKGVLLYGPPGTGKTLIAQAVANESGATFFPIQGPEIMGRYYGQSEERLRDLFKEAEENAPSIIFLDEIDSIAPNRDSVTGEVERRIVAQLLTLMDGMSARGDVIVIGATNREDSIDPALRRPGRFDREIEIGIPGRNGRKDILEVHMRGMPLGTDVDIEHIASVTQGFVGADLAALAREAAMKCLRRKMPELDLDKPIPSNVLAGMRVIMDDFLAALAEIEPSGMREVIVEIPRVTWSDVGGLDDVKREIREAFIPSEDPKAFERLGIRPAKGVLFYGPPGTGKTLIAKAVANESGANFICVNGPEIASKWLGESEKAIRQIFKRAKQMAPCIIFFDEMDSVAPKRGSSGSSSWEKVVNQLLTSMDGVESLKNVMVMGATNRPDMIDPALLRPGRFDKLILIGAPDLGSRKKILGVHTKNMPLRDVDTDLIARETEGYVGADLEAVCREAGMEAYREDPDIEYVEMRHFDAALMSVRPSVDAEVIKGYESISAQIKKRRTSWDDMPFYG
ncbi:MAG: CDC48 family AAA ATPase [Methanomassiliicoccaceae archaeon]|jgi:transitional endoplasmic reticulum ATPase|nr:CDC48 family AAA ATPase [Methanomassiliicoccaceae archaeon]